MGGGVEVAPCGAALGPGGPRRRVDPDAAHPREVDRPRRRRSVPKPGPLWPPPRTASVEAVLAGVVDRRHHVAGIGHPHDHRGASVDHPVVNRPGLVVARVAGGHHFAPHLVTQFVQRLSTHDFLLWFVSFTT